MKRLLQFFVQCLAISSNLIADLIQLIMFRWSINCVETLSALFVSLIGLINIAELKIQVYKRKTTFTWITLVLACCKVNLIRDTDISPIVWVGDQWEPSFASAVPQNPSVMRKSWKVFSSEDNRRIVKSSLKNVSRFDAANDQGTIWSNKKNENY